VIVVVIFVIITILLLLLLLVVVISVIVAGIESLSASMGSCRSHWTAAEVPIPSQLHDPLNADCDEYTTRATVDNDFHILGRSDGRSAHFLLAGEQSEATPQVIVKRLHVVDIIRFLSGIYRPTYSRTYRRLQISLVLLQ